MTQTESMPLNKSDNEPAFAGRAVMLRRSPLPDDDITGKQRLPENARWPMAVLLGPPVVAISVIIPGLIQGVGDAPKTPQQNRNARTEVSAYVCDGEVLNEGKIALPRHTFVYSSNPASEKSRLLLQTEQPNAYDMSDGSVCLTESAGINWYVLDGSQLRELDQAAILNPDKDGHVWVSGEQVVRR